MHANVKPLTHWAIYKGYKLRFRDRTPARVVGVLTDSAGSRIEFAYLPDALIIQLPDAQVQINEFGWEVECRKMP